MQVAWVPEVEELRVLSEEAACPVGAGGCAHAGLVGRHSQLASSPGRALLCLLSVAFVSVGCQPWPELSESPKLGAAVAFKTFAHLYLHHSFIHVSVHLTHLMRVSKAPGTFAGFRKRGVTLGSPVILKPASHGLRCQEAVFHCKWLTPHTNAFVVVWERIIITVTTTAATIAHLLNASYGPCT